MKYLSIDLEATGLREDDLIIEFGMVPFCAESNKLEMNLAKNYFIKCPSFEDLKPNLDPWVIEHNEGLITKAHDEGLSMETFKSTLEDYLNSKEIKDYFGKDKIVLFGKSMSAIDLPFMNRDLGWKWMRKYFQHRQLDLTSVSYNLIDFGVLPKECESGSELMKYLEMGEVCHTALEDAVNTAIMYLKIKEKFLA